jgi:hypothetical protein
LDETLFEFGRVRRRRRHNLESKTTIRPKETEA